MEAWYTHAVGAYALIKRYRGTAETPRSPAISCLLNTFAKLLMASYPILALFGTTYLTTASLDTHNLIAQCFR